MAMKPLLFTNDHAGSISWVVYIGGIEIPSSGIDVSYGVWEIPQAAIRLVPDPILHRLGAEDRIPVQAFYLDQWQHSPPKYCLLFDGEIIAWGKQNTGAGRSITFTCADYMAILTQTFFFLMSTFDDFAVGASSASIGVSAAGVQTPGFGALYPYSLFAQGMANTEDIQADRLIERPIDYAYNIVRALIRLQQPNRAVPAANFFTPWTKRTHFHKRWVATPYFDADPQDPHAPGLFPVLKEVQDSDAIAAIARQSAAAANGSLWSMIQEVLRTVMCELAMLPTAAAVKSDYRSLLPQGAPDAPSYGSAPVFLTQYFVKPQTYYSLPPVCNVFFPSQIQSGGYSENYAAQPTRAYYNETTITNILSGAAGNGGIGSASTAGLMQDAMTTGYPEEVDIAVRDARDAALQNGKNMLVYPEEYFKGPVVLRKQLPRWFAYILDASRGGLEQSGGSADTSTGGAAELNNASQYSESEGGPVYFGQERHPRGSFLLNLRITQFNSLPTELHPTNVDPSRQRIILTQSLAVGTPGDVMPPQVFPIRPASAFANYQNTNQRSVGGFWQIRGAGTDIHGGHDIGAPIGTEACAPVTGTIAKIISAPREQLQGGSLADRAPHKAGIAPTNATSRSDTLGNCVIIRDSRGGLHRLAHLRSINAGLSAGMTVNAGEVIGTVGQTGSAWTRGAHLHYDIMDAQKKYRFPFGRRLMSLCRNPGATTAPPSEIAHQEGGTAPHSDVENAAMNPTTHPNADRANGGTGAIGTDVAAGDTTRNLFKLYAKCDYYTERYAQRSGVLAMPFNPYPIPGFGLAAFDRRGNELDTVGYLTNIQHTIAATGWGTTVSYSQGRTFQEMFALIQRDAALDNARMGRDAPAISAAVDTRYETATTRIAELIAAQVTGSTTTADQEAKWQRGEAPGIPWISPAAAAQGAQSTSDNPTGSSSYADPNVPSVDAVLGGYAAPAGDVRMAPAEPIEEIRQLQDLDRADAFYRALFWQALDQPSSADLTAEDVIGADRERGARGRASFLTPEQAAAAGENPSRETIASALNAATNASETASRAARAAITARSRISNEISCVFRQEDIIRMVTPDEDVLDIENSGTSSMSRTSALALIHRCAYSPQLMTEQDRIRLCDTAAGESRASGMTPERLYECLPRTTYPNGTPNETGQWAYVPCPRDQQTLLEFLHAQERRWRTQSATTNVRGDVEIVPTAAAQGLFESYQLAMKYNARPVCTLDEYLLFLGEDAAPAPPGGILRTQSNLGQNDYLHPAKYYAEIRTYMQGPPRARARTLLSGRATGEDEALVEVPGEPVDPNDPHQVLEAPDADAAASEDPLTTTPASFPKAQRNPAKAIAELAASIPLYTVTAPELHGAAPSDAFRARVDAILTAYLTGGLVQLPDGVQPVSAHEAAQVGENVRNVILARGDLEPPGIPPIVAAPFLAAFRRPQRFADPLPDDQGQVQASDNRVRAFIASSTSAQRNVAQATTQAREQAERTVVGQHTLQGQYIAGVPASFPDTRADWYAVLSRYRENTLRRQDPRR